MAEDDLVADILVENIRWVGNLVDKEVIISQSFIIIVVINN